MKSTKFWQEQADIYIDWRKPYSAVFDDSNAPFYRWFSGGELNISELCIDRHLAQKSDQDALIWEGEQGEVRHITYGTLSEEVGKFANLLKSCSVKKGDRVIIYMPMIPETVYAMLACARIGAVHSVVFGGFSAEVIADRVKDTGAKIVITADGASRGGNYYLLKPTLDEAISQDGIRGQIERVIVVEHNNQPVDYTPSRDIKYREVIEKQSSHCDAESMQAEDPFFILYTSGSTGKPKGILHTQAGYILWAQYTTQHVFDIQPHDTFWCAADIGWVTGHTYTVYGPLALGSTTLIYEGVPFYPDSGRYWQTIEKHHVTQFYTAPTALRMVKKFGADLPAKYDLSSLRVLGSVGEPIDPETWQWYYAAVGGSKCPIVDTWWQTETGGHVISPLPGKTKLKPGCATLPLPGLSVEVLTHDGTVASPGQKGLLCITEPWPSMFRTVWNDNKRYLSYFNEVSKADRPVYFSGDGAYTDEDGYIHVTGRVDDVLNISGHRVGAAEIEAALAGHPNVAESAIVSQPDDIKGEKVFAFVVLRTESEHEELKNQLNNQLKEEIGPFITVSGLLIVPGLPKTRSGKVLRRILRTIANSQAVVQDISTLDDPAVVAKIQRLFAEHIVYQPGYQGRLTTYVDPAGTDLSKLFAALNESFANKDVTAESLAPAFESDSYNQLIVVEEYNNRPTIVGAANVSVLPFSFNDDMTTSSEPTLWLDSMVAHPDIRGKGIGTRLWQEITSVARSQGIRRLQFTSNQCRKDAHAFYDKMGAKQLGTIWLTKHTDIHPSKATEVQRKNSGVAFETASGKFGLVAATAADVGSHDSPIAAAHGVSTIKYLTLDKPEDSLSYETVLFSADL